MLQEGCSPALARIRGAAETLQSRPWWDAHRRWQPQNKSYCGAECAVGVTVLYCSYLSVVAVDPDSRRGMIVAGRETQVMARRPPCLRLAQRILFSPYAPMLHPCAPARGTSSPTLAVYSRAARTNHVRGLSLASH